MLKLALIFTAFLAVTVWVEANVVENKLAFVKIFDELHKDPAPQITKEADNVKTLWIEQKLDHFDANETRTWKMRYMANDEFYKPGGPLFIFVGGEWSISAGAISAGRHIYDMAREHNGSLFYTEHRYYGESHPVKSMTNENMKYLNVRQALADLAHFIRTMKATIPGMEKSEVILVGGSYSATMVVWFKKLYPELATGGWASSAPLRATPDYFEYKEIMGESIKLVGGAACYGRIQRGIAELETMFAMKRSAEVKAMLKLCNSFDEYNDLNVWTLFYEISELFANLVQTHNDGDMQTACKSILKGTSDVVGIANYILSKFGKIGCNNFSYRSYLPLFMNTSLSNNTMRPWIYQTCNEFGWYQTSTSRNQPFGTKFPLVFFTTLCADAYGKQFTNEFIHNQTLETNRIFGGLEPQVENVYMTHGQLDPWRAAGIQDEEQVTIIPNHAHCKDLGSISSEDTPELRASKEKIAELVRQWLSD